MNFLMIGLLVMVLVIVFFRGALRLVMKVLMGATKILISPFGIVLLFLVFVNMIFDIVSFNDLIKMPDLMGLVDNTEGGGVDELLSTLW